LYREEALKVEKKLDAILMQYNVMDHDSGFRWLPTAVAHWRVEKNPESENRALLAAANMAGRFNLAGQFIRAWNDFGDRDRRGYAIIDCMMNLPLLYWASSVTEDPRFAQIAMAHADTAMKAFVREDGSVNHIVNFDINTGEALGPVDGQGMAPDSSWTRGQSWGIYGFTLSFLHTGKKEYRETAERIADYVISAIPESNIVPVDYCQPKDIPWEDSTAAAITACGLIELAKCEDDEAKAEKYLGKALELLKTLDAKRCCWDETRDELLEKCTAAYHDKEHDFTIIYGDYYFIEAVYKLCGTELFIW
ncbi:MAG: glycoside hydrolase family 88 protein, partial [Lachnospiraceae bacterium]|nr:glycoside hydrolase family 88 protein [Lachnospiraceae bacterium]